MPENQTMKTKNLPVLCALLLSLALPVLGYAQTSADASATQPLVLTAGEIKRVDLDGGKVTIKHGEIKNLEMPPMTMVFVAKDRSQLASLKAGDKVNFVVLNEAGKFIAAEIQAVQ
jgi:Cu(I)/Ag(I) efflux system protein CusF